MKGNFDGECILIIQKESEIESFLSDLINGFSKRKRFRDAGDGNIHTSPY